VDQSEFWTKPKGSAQLSLEFGLSRG